MTFLSLATFPASAHLGLAITYPAAGVIERIGAEWDWIWLDGQHGEICSADVLALVRACDLVGRPALVRVPGHDAGEIGRVLDMGAAGVIVPCVDTVEQANRLVTAAKFPPTGNRSYGGRRPIDLQGRAYCRSANTDTLLVVQIESPLAVSNAEAIAALTGIDALFLGPDDILLRRGFDMTAPRTPDMLRPDMQAVVEASHKHGKAAVTVGVAPEMLALCLDLGYDMIVAGGDVGFLANGSQQASTRAREVLRAREVVEPVPGVPAGPSPATGVY